LKRIVDEEQGIVADIEHKTRAFFTRYERSFEGFGFEGLLDNYVTMVFKKAKLARFRDGSIRLVEGPIGRARVWWSSRTRRAVIWECGLDKELAEHYRLNLAKAATSIWNFVEEYLKENGVVEARVKEVEAERFWELLGGLSSFLKLRGYQRTSMPWIVSKILRS